MRKESSQKEPSAVQLREELRVWHEQANGHIEEQAFTRTQARRLAEQLEAISVDGIYPFKGHVKVVEAHLYVHILVQVLTPYSDSGERVTMISLDRNSEPNDNLDEQDVDTIIEQAEQSSEGDELRFAALVKEQLLTLTLKDLEAFETLFGCWNERSYSPVVRRIAKEIKEGLPHS